MDAVILAAGVGSRLRGVTDRPKCLLDLHGKPIIHHQISALRASGVQKINVILGHRAADIEQVLPEDVSCHYYKDYAVTNNLWTLASGSRFLRGALLILFADVLLQPEAFRELVRDDSDVALLSDGRQCRLGTMRVKTIGERLIDIGGHIPPEDGHGNFVGIAKLSATGSSALSSALHSAVDGGQWKTDYYTRVIPQLSQEGLRVNVHWLHGRKWLEIDEEADLHHARKQDFFLLQPTSNNNIERS